MALLSPGDVEKERRIVEQIVDALDRWATKRKFRLRAVEWEKVSRGYFPEGAQAHIREDLAIERCDLVVAIFDSRFGIIDQPPYSRTATEVRDAIKAKQDKGAPQIFVYFAKRTPGPLSDVSDQERKRVDDFKNELLNDPCVFYYEYEPTLFLTEVLWDLLNHLDSMMSLSSKEPGGLNYRLACVPVLVRSEGQTEITGDIQLAVRGTPNLADDSEVIKADITVTLSTNITNRVDLKNRHEFTTWLKDITLVSKSKGLLARASFSQANRFTTISFDSILLGRRDTELDDVFSICGIRSHAVFACGGPISALVEVFTTGAPNAVLREKVIVALSVSPTATSVEPVQVKVLPLNETEAFAQIVYRAFSRELPWQPFLEAFKTREQESNAETVADCGTIFAVQCSDIPRDCKVCMTIRELPSEDDPAVQERAIAIKTDLLGNRGSHPERVDHRPEFLWMGEIPMCQQPESGLSCWELVQPLPSGKVPLLAFGLVVVGPSEVLSLSMLGIAGTLAPFYASKGCGHPSGSLPIPRFLPTGRLRVIHLSLK